MKQKKVCALMLAGILMGTMFAGCGDSQEDSSGKTNSAAEATEEADTGNEEAASGEKQKIELWHYFNETSQSALNEVISEYNASQDKYEVEATYIARDDLMKQYTLGAVSGELPDLGMVDNPDMASYISMGVFEEITEKAEEWGELSNFYESALSTCYQDDKLYGLPSNTNSLILYYNKTLLDKAGMEVPETWDQLYETAKALTKEDTYGFEMSAKGGEEGTFNVMPWLTSAGVDISALDSEDAINTMNFLKKLVDEGIMSDEVVNWGQSDVKNAFVAGKTAMMQNGSWYIPEIDAENPSFEWGVALLPKDKENSSCIGGENIGICAGANVEGAWDFLSYFMGAEQNADFCEGAAKFPVRSDSMTLKPVWSEDARYQVASQALETAHARGPEPQWPTISQAIYTSTQAILLGEKDVETAMSEAAAQVAEALQ